MSRGDRKAMIRRDHPALGLGRQREVPSISRSSFYYAPKGESPENLALWTTFGRLTPRHWRDGSSSVIERLWRSLKYTAVYLHELTDGFKAERVIGEWIGFDNTGRPHSPLGGQTLAEAYGPGQPMDMMDKPDGLPTFPQAQHQQKDVINRCLAA